MNLDKNLNEKLQVPQTLKDVERKKENRPIIGMTFFDKNKYGLKHLYQVYKNDKFCVNKLYEFLEMARTYSTVSELVKNHASHVKFKNEDDLSRNKLLQIQKQYRIETNDMCHLHCGMDGSGKFVLHGFFIANCFEIVWLDVNHDHYK